MREWTIAVAICLTLIIGLKDGRIARMDGYPVIKFDAVIVNGEKVECVLIIIDGKAYPVPISMIEGMIFVPDEKAM